MTTSLTAVQCPKMTVEAINAFLAETFTGGTPPLVTHADPVRAVCRTRSHPDQLRPGGTVSGPTMMALADTVTYALVFAAVGLRPLAVTSQLSISFLRKPAPGDLVAEARMLRLGRRQAVMAVEIRSADDPPDADPVAHATVTYAIPPAEAGSA